VASYSWQRTARLLLDALRLGPSVGLSSAVVASPSLIDTRGR
jgi:hypothetical protein